jgi:hypothetical protein
MWIGKIDTIRSMYTTTGKREEEVVRMLHAQGNQMIPDPQKIADGLKSLCSLDDGIGNWLKP